MFDFLIRKVRLRPESEVRGIAADPAGADCRQRFCDQLHAVRGGERDYFWRGMVHRFGRSKLAAGRRYRERQRPHLPRPGRKRSPDVHATEGQHAVGECESLPAECHIPDISLEISLTGWRREPKTPPLIWSQYEIFRAFPNLLRCLRAPVRGRIHLQGP